MKQSQVHGDWLDDIIIKRLPGNIYTVKGLEDETLSRRQFVKLMQYLGYAPCEIAFMDLEFRENPSFTIAVFGGIKATFFYCK